MYIHLGGDTVVPLREVVGIFDMDGHHAFQKHPLLFGGRSKRAARGDKCHDRVAPGRLWCVPTPTETKPVYICQIAPRHCAAAPHGDTPR